MALTKLTLTVDEDVVRRAREYTQRRRTSISRLVNAFLDGLEERAPSTYPPVIQRLMGILPADVDEEDYHRYLEEKYGT